MNITVYVYVPSKHFVAWAGRFRSHSDLAALWMHSVQEQQQILWLRSNSGLDVFMHLYILITDKPREYFKHHHGNRGETYFNKCELIWCKKIFCSHTHTADVSLKLDTVLSVTVFDQSCSTFSLHATDKRLTLSWLPISSGCSDRKPWMQINATRLKTWMQAMSLWAANLAIHATWITGCGVHHFHRLHHLHRSKLKILNFSATLRDAVLRQPVPSMTSQRHKRCVLYRTDIKSDMVVKTTAAVCEYSELLQHDLKQCGIMLRTRHNAITFSNISLTSSTDTEQKWWLYHPQSWQKKWQAPVPPEANVTSYHWCLNYGCL